MTDLKQRTKLFALSMISVVEKLPNVLAVKIVAYQLIKSGTSVGANYRAACRARSDKEFVSKINIVLEEVDECCYWLEIIQDKKWLETEELDPVLKEANELNAIFVSSLKTMKSRMGKQ